MGVRVVMLSGDNQATATRIADQLGIDTAIAEVLPGDKAAKIAELRPRAARPRWSVTGSTTPGAGAGRSQGGHRGGFRRRHRDRRSGVDAPDPLDVPIALRIGRGTLRKMRWNLVAVGYNVIALPIAARGIPMPAFDLRCARRSRPCRCPGSSLIVAVNALMLKRLKLPAPQRPTRQPPPDGAARGLSTPHGPPPARLPRSGAGLRLVW